MHSRAVMYGRYSSDRQGMRRSALEGIVLDLLKTRLVQPNTVAAFVKDFAEASNAQGVEQSQIRGRLEAERTCVKRKLEGLYDAIADGLRSPGLKEKLLELEARVVAIEEALWQPAPCRCGLTQTCRSCTGGRFRNWP